MSRVCSRHLSQSNRKILVPDKSLVRDYTTWQALLDELLLFPQGEHDDLFDDLQTMMEGVMSVHSYHEGMAACVGSMRDDWDDFDDMEEFRKELYR